MQRTGAPLSYSAEKELRRLLEGKEAEMERQRRRASRIFSLVLLVGFVLMAAAIFLYPDKPKPAAKGAKQSATTAASPVIAGLPKGQVPQVFAPVAEDKEMDKDLKPFAVKPGQQQGNKEDLRFAMDLLNFSHSADKVPEPAKPAAAAQTSKVEKPAVRK